MKNYALFIVRRRWFVIVGWILLLVIMGAVSKGIGGAEYKDVFKLPGTETQAVADVLKASNLDGQNGINGQMVLHSTSGDLTQPPASFLTAMDSICDPQYKVVSIDSPWGSVNCTATGKFVTTGKQPFLLADNQQIAIVNITFSGEKYDQKAITATWNDLKKLNSDDLQVAFTGNAFDSIDVINKKGGISPEAFGFIAALIILSIVFRTFGAMATPLISAAVALTLGLDLIAVLTHIMNVSNVTQQLATLMVIGVGIDYALFIVTRHRRNLQHGMSIPESIAVAVNTSGRAVLFAGGTVCIAMLGLCALGVNFFYGLAFGVSIAVAMTMFASLTLLPAVLSLLGQRILPRSRRDPLPSDKTVKILLCVIPPICFVFWVLYTAQWLLKPYTRRRTAHKVAAGPKPSFWHRWSEFVANHKAIVGSIAGIVIVLLAIPFFSMRMGHADQGNDPKWTTTRKGYDLISQGWGKGYNSNLLLVVHGPDAAEVAATAGEAVKTVPNVNPASVFVIPNPPDSQGKPVDDVALITLKAQTAPQDAATTELVHTLRKHVLPPIYEGTDSHVYVYGDTAVFADFTQVLSNKMPLFIGAVVLLSFLLLMLAFRSLLVPLTAAVMNLFAAAASFGLIVAIFQWGWFAEPLGIGRGGPIEAFAPVIFFAVLFGLSMDYQVFLVSRMHEEWVHTHDNRRSIIVGQGETGGIITAAAIIMIAVFGGFILGDGRVVKLIGIGLASAVFIDAFILRTILVPAIMHTIGKANWYFPKWLERYTPKVSLESAGDDDWEDIMADETIAKAHSSTSVKTPV